MANAMKEIFGGQLRREGDCRSMKDICARDFRKFCEYYLADIPDWLKGDNYFVNYNSKWLRTGYDSNDKYGWMTKIFAEGIENARKNQGDLDERMGTLNDILQNSREAEGNMEVMQSEIQMQGLMDSEITRRSRLLANHAQVQAAGDRLRLDKERRAMLAEDRVMTFKIMDRNNMTEQDNAVGVKEGSGFKNF